MENEQNKWQWHGSNVVWRGVGIYHITLTIPSREPLLGTLVIPGNNPAQAKVERTKLGNSLVEELLHIPAYYPEIRILQFCLMPDHLHAIIHVTQVMETSIRSVIRGYWQGVKKHGRAYTLAVTAEFNSAIRNEGGYSFPVFTERPFIRPLSRRGQLQTMIRYVRMNPERLATKRLRPGYFRVQRDIEIGLRKYDGVGNVAILMANRFDTVHVRKLMVEEAKHGETEMLRNYMNSRVLKARKGEVMVSPFISPHEKQVMDVLLRELRPIILLADNGFREYYKPSDALFDACAAGRVLILSAWPFDAQKRHISRAECVQLNAMAEEICESLNHHPNG